MRDIGIYVHIPFCKKKCSYCDFVSYENKTEKIEEYIKYIKKEIYQTAEGARKDIECKLIKPFRINTIYIGGGTPSYISENYINKKISYDLKKYINIYFYKKSFKKIKKHIKTYIVK